MTILFLQETTNVFEKKQPSPLKKIITWNSTCPNERLVFSHLTKIFSISSSLYTSFTLFWGKKRVLCFNVTLAGWLFVVCVMRKCLRSFSFFQLSFCLPGENKIPAHKAAFKIDWWIDSIESIPDRVHVRPTGFGHCLHKLLSHLDPGCNGHYFSIENCNSDVHE